MSWEAYHSWCCPGLLPLTLIAPRGGTHWGAKGWEGVFWGEGRPRAQRRALGKPHKDPDWGGRLSGPEDPAPTGSLRLSRGGPAAGSRCLSAAARMRSAGHPSCSPGKSSKKIKQSTEEDTATNCYPEHSSQEAAGDRNLDKGKSAPLWAQLKVWIHPAR